MSRYQPPPQTRDRSPPRFAERRSSVTQNGPPGPRIGENVSQASLDRAPPRGPKAHYDGPQRGRGGFRGSFGGRSEYRDRERDFRPPVNAERGDEGRSDWQRRDRDFNTGDRGGLISRGGRGYTERDRSASPVRVRRGSSEALPIHNSRSDGPTNFYGTPVRGGYAGRGGRGDWERNRDRGSFVSERDRDFLPARSRSRDDFATRDRDRERELELDRKDRSDRWEPEASRDRDLKSREHDVWQRDRSTGRQSSGSGPISVAPPAQSRGDQNTSGTISDPARRRSAAFIPSTAVREWRRDGDVPNYSSRSERSRDGPLTRKVSPPSAPPAAASSALDYGPPPAAKLVETSTDPGVSQRDPVPKTEPLVTSSASFLPPTGPKAERPIAPSLQAPQLKSPTNEQWTKPEPQARTLRPAPMAPIVTRPPEQSRVQERSQDTMSLDRSPQTNVPSGPRASLMTNKPRMLPQQGLMSGKASAGPMSAAKISPTDFRSAIPTGPRSERDGLKARPGPPWPTGNATWTSPDYKTRPSIMNNLQSKPPFDGREIHRPQTAAFNQLQKPRFQPPIIPRSRPANQKMDRDEVTAQVAAIDNDGRVIKPEEETDSAVDVNMSLNPSSDDEVDDDGLDEEDFAHSEEKFKKQMRQLEAMKPPPPLEDPSVIELLLKIQFLGLIIEGVPLQAIEPLVDDPGFDKEPTATGLLSPEQRQDEQIHVPTPRRILGRPLSKPPVNPIPTPPLDELPYLKKSTPQFELFKESDDEVQHEAVVTAMRNDFEKLAWQQNEAVDQIHSFYNDQYPVWKRAVAELDRLRLDAKQPSPRPTTPVPPMPIVIAQPPTTERPSRASMRNATEYDLEKVMEESKMMEQERKEAREREAAELEASGARPDYNQEALVPDMIDPSEKDLSAFRDENWKVPPALALDIFEYVPPVDDFTEEEQVLFTQAFVVQPKRWGRIAESLDRRDYKQCIMHYYLTKNDAAYKERVRAAQPRKRRGRVAAKPRNSALGDLVLSYDGGPTAVTDSGRPRRAAAPTFGEGGTDSEAVTPALIGAKRGARIMDPATQTAEKPTRAKRVSIGVTKPRRSKKVVAEAQQQTAQMLQDASGAAISPQKFQPPTPRAAMHRLKEMPVLVEPTQVVDVHTFIEQEMAQPPLLQDIERNNGITGSSGSSTAPQITSYWSVPEQQKFPDLLAYFGRDFVAIADFMKTKSSTMIKNFYTRELNTGKKELEDAARRAEGMRERGEPMGPPPTPVAPPKRRYEATPSMASLPRPMTNLDMTAPDPMLGVVAPGSAMIDDFPANTIQRSARGELVAKSRISRDILGSGVLQQRVEEANQPIRNPLFEPKQGLGPRPGFFPQERQEIRPASQGMRGNAYEQPGALQLSHRTQDHARPYEHLQQQQQQQQAPPPPLFPQQSLQLTQDTQNRTATQPGTGRQSFYQAEPSTQQQHHASLGHTRHDSAGVKIAHPHEHWDHDAESASFRRQPPHRGLQYGPASSQQAQPSLQATADPRGDVPRPASTPLALPSEPQKPVPTKRSDIFFLLDDGGPIEPVPKRASLEGASSQSVQSPSLSALAHESMRQRQPLRSNTPLAPQGSRPHYLQSASSRPGQSATSEFSTQFGGSSGPSASRDNWLSKFDPRQQSGVADHVQASVQQSAVQYGSSNPPPTSLARLQMDMPARQESSHRSTLGQLQHPGHAPSPTPAPLSIRGGTVMPQFRSASGSSQVQQHHHGRVSSIDYPQNQTQQLPGHPSSAEPVPVSTLHQSRGSLSGYDDQRFTQQREHQLREQQIRDHQMREQQAREQEVRQREYDLQQQQQQQQQHTYMQARQQQRTQEMEQERFRYTAGSPRTFTPPNAPFPKPMQQLRQSQPQPPPQAQHSAELPSHYRQFSQGGVEERR